MGGASAHACGIQRRGCADRLLFRKRRVAQRWRFVLAEVCPRWCWFGRLYVLRGGQCAADIFDVASRLRAPRRRRLPKKLLHSLASLLGSRPLLISLRARSLVPFFILHPSLSCHLVQRFLRRQHTTQSPEQRERQPQQQLLGEKQAARHNPGRRDSGTFFLMQRLGPDFFGLTVSSADSPPARTAWFSFALLVWLGRRRSSALRCCPPRELKVQKDDF